MGPYCHFCNNRCFVPITDALWSQMTEQQRKCYQGRSTTILATCPGGQAFEKEKIGVCLHDIRVVHALALFFETVATWAGAQTYRVAVRHVITRWYTVQATSSDEARELASNRTDSGDGTPLEKFLDAEVYTYTGHE